MAIFDKEHIGDNQEKAWRPFNNSHFTDGINDFGYYGNSGAGLWSGQPIHNFFNIDKAFSASFWCTPILGNNGLAFPLHITDALSSQAFFIGNIGLRLGQTQNFVVFTPLVLQNITQHIVITYTGNSQPNGVKLYVNSVDLATIGQINVIDYGTRVINTYIQNYYQRQTDDPLNYFTSKIADFRFFADQVLTPQEVRKLYHGNWETDLVGRTELLRLPMTLPSHFATNTPAGLCTALDISGNANNLIIEGQGTTPTTPLFY
jgi:hypothetical protein